MGLNELSFEMCIHFRFQNVHSFSFSKCERFCDFCFSFFRKTQQHNCKQTAVHSLKIALLMRLWKNNEIYMKLLNLFLLSRIYNLLHVKEWWCGSGRGQNIGKKLLRHILMTLYQFRHSIVVTFVRFQKRSFVTKHPLTWKIGV